MATTPKTENAQPAPTAAQALTALYSMKAANRHAALTVLAVEEPALFLKLADQAK